jgi:hypothetical protein
VRNPSTLSIAEVELFKGRSATKTGGFGIQCRFPTLKDRPIDQTFARECPKYGSGKVAVPLTFGGSCFEIAERHKMDGGGGQGGDAAVPQFNP